MASVGMKLYDIEQKSTSSGSDSEFRWRYFSLFNGAHGSWCYTKEMAVGQGERHQEIIEAMANGIVGNIKVTPNV